MSNSLHDSTSTPPPRERNCQHRFRNFSHNVRLTTRHIEHEIAAAVDRALEEADADTDRLGLVGFSLTTGLTMHVRLLAIRLSLFITPALVHAQHASPDSMPHAGTWGAEGFVGTSGSGASILRFRSPNVAFLFGADISYSHLGDSEGTIPLLSGTNANVGARFGVRNYRGSGADRLRPVVGAGLRTSYAEAVNSKVWSGGAYGELGAMYFLTPHISLGGTGELQASYGKRKQTVVFQTGNEETSKQDITTVAASLMRVMLAVYF